MSVVPSLKTDFLTLYDALPQAARDAMLPTLQMFKLFVNYYAPSEPVAPHLPTLSPCDPVKYAQKRAELVDRIWDFRLHAELVDRIMLALVNKLTTSVALDAAINAAVESHAVIWQALVPWLRQVYEGAGYEWTQTSPPIEPPPERLVKMRRAERRESARVKETLAQLDKETVSQ